MTSADAHLGLNYRLGKDSVVTVGVDGFNLFNSQRPTRVDENYTGNSVGPIIGKQNSGLPSPIGAIVSGSYDTTKSYADNVALGNVIRPSSGSLPRPGFVNGGPANVLLFDPAQNVNVVQTNPNWGRALTYQTVRSFRFSVRYTF